MPDLRRSDHLVRNPRRGHHKSWVPSFCGMGMNREPSWFDNIDAGTQPLLVGRSTDSI